MGRGLEMGELGEQQPHAKLVASKEGKRTSLLPQWEVQKNDEGTCPPCCPCDACPAQPATVKHRCGCDCANDCKCAKSSEALCPKNTLH